MVIEERVEDGAVVEQDWQWQWGDYSHSEESAELGQVEVMNAIAGRMAENGVQGITGYRFRGAFVMSLPWDCCERDRVVELIGDLVEQSGYWIYRLHYQTHEEPNPAWSMAVFYGPPGVRALRAE